MGKGGCSEMEGDQFIQSAVSKGREGMEGGSGQERGRL